MGIQNLNATCYMASSLQLLAAVPSFRRTMARHLRTVRSTMTPPPPQSAVEILKAYNGFLVDWIQADWPIDLSPFFTVVRKWSCYKDVKDQEDAQEFSSWLIDKLHESLDRKEVHVKDIERKKQEGILSWTDRIAPQLIPTPEDSPLLHSYGGLYLDGTTCARCFKRGQSLQPFSLLPLSLPTSSEHTLPCRVWYFPDKLAQSKPNKCQIDVIGTWVNIPIESTVWAIREQLANHFMISPKQCLIAQSNYPLDLELAQTATTPRLVPRLTAGNIFHGSRNVLRTAWANESKMKSSARTSGCSSSMKNSDTAATEQLIINEEKNVEISFNEFTSSSPPVLLCYESSFPWLYTELQELTPVSSDIANSVSPSAPLPNSPLEAPFLPRPHYLDKTSSQWKRPPPSTNSFVNTTALSLVVQIVLKWQPFPHPTSLSKCAEAWQSDRTASTSYGLTYNVPDQGPNSPEVQDLYYSIDKEFRRNLLAPSNEPPSRKCDAKDVDYSRVNIVTLPSNLGDVSTNEIPDAFPLLIAIPRWVTGEQLLEYMETILAKYMEGSLSAANCLERRIVDCKATYEKLVQTVVQEIELHLEALDGFIEHRNFLLEENAHIRTSQELLNNLYERDGDSSHMEEAYCRELVELIMTYQNIRECFAVFERTLSMEHHSRPTEQNDSDFVSLPPDTDDTHQELRSLIASTAVASHFSTGTATNSTPDVHTKYNQYDSQESYQTDGGFASPDMANSNSIAPGSNSLAGGAQPQAPGVNYAVRVTSPDLAFCYTCPVDRHCTGWEWIPARQGRSLRPKYESPLSSPCLVHWNPAEPTFINTIGRRISEGNTKELKHMAGSLDGLSVDNPVSYIMSNNLPPVSLHSKQGPAAHYNCTVSPSIYQAYLKYEAAALGSGISTTPITLTVELQPGCKAAPAAKTSMLFMDRKLLHDVYQRGKPKGEHPISLELLIYKSHVDELLRGENALCCETCKVKKLTRRRHKIWSFGDVIFFQLNRFQQAVEDTRAFGASSIILNSFSRFGEMDQSTTRKNRAEVGFVCDGLDLTWLQAKSFWGNDTDKVYDLVGIISHEGSSLMCGHYTAVTRTDLRGPWRFYDDESVVTSGSIQASDRKNAYILAYTARSV